MYTECPECRSAFRLTVTVLRQAHGRVRCGRCGHVFDALDHLQEERDGKASAAAGETSAGDRFERQSRELLETLDDLAVPDEVRIEDTGVEWRVYDDEADDESAGTTDDAAQTGSIRWYLEEPDAGRERAGNGGAPGDEPSSAASDALALGEDTRDWRLDDAGEREPAFDDTQTRLDLGREPADEMRYDDNTPLPEDEGGPATPPTPRRRAEDLAAPPLDHEFQVDLALGDPDDWRALLTEVETEADGAAAVRVADEDVPELDDAIDETSSRDASRVAGPEPAAPSTAETSAIAAERELDEALADTGDDDQRRATSAVDLQIDEDLMREAERRDAAGTGEEESAPPTDSGLYETIVMEGDTISGLLTDDGEDEGTADRTPAATLTNEPPAPEEPAVDADAAAATRRPAWRGIAAATVLGVLLAAQLVHANREALATIEPVRETLGPIYRALGDPLTPAWNVRGWRFEATNGSTDASGEHLTIYTRLANESDGPLPYPLVHVSLTDRFEEVIGSRILDAGDYLAGGADPERPVRPGRNFTAVITIDGPADEAMGYKLNVCYRLAAERLRCAIEDFKD